MAKKTLTLKQKLFAKAYVKNKGNASKSALEVYDVNKRDAKNLGHQVLQKQEVKDEIEHLLNKKGLNRDYFVDAIKDSIEINLRDGKPSQAVASDLIKFGLKLHNAVPSTKHMNMNVSMKTNLSSLEFEKVMAKLTDLHTSTTKLLEDSK